MRRPRYLSPTSINLYYRDIEEFYCRYLTEHRPPRMKQTRPMSIGSAFDAYVKSYLHEKLFGKGADPMYERDTLFEEQVEEHNWDWARVHGAHAMEIYRQSGALADLLIELNKAVGDPVFEVSLEGKLSVNRAGVDPTPVNFLGKPDIYFINKLGNPVILDWKVNGWCSKRGASPKKGYLKLRHGSNVRSLDKPHHRDCQPMMHQGMMINAGITLDMVDKDWATQLAIYAWLCGCDIGSDFITGLDQLACKPNELGGQFPDVRIAEHRLRVGRQFQWETFLKAQEVWDVVHSDHIFRDMSEDESRRKCETLDAQCKSLTQMSNSDDPMDKLFMEMTK